MLEMKWVKVAIASNGCQSTDTGWLCRQIWISPSFVISITKKERSVYGRATPTRYELYPESETKFFHARSGGCQSVVC